MATQFRKPGVRLLTGVAELDAKLAELKLGTANKIARPALTKAARMLLKKMKQAVPSPYKDVKRALGMVVDTKGGKSRNQQRAKVGAAVGKSSKAEQKDRNGKPGVGIGSKNVHWFLLGTKARQTKAGKSTGTMQPIMPGLVKNTTASFKSEMIAVMTEEVKTRLAALAQKS